MEYFLIRIPLFFVIAGLGSVLVSETKLYEAQIEDERELAKSLQPQLQSAMYELKVQLRRLSELYNISLKIADDQPLKRKLDDIIYEITNFISTDINLIFLLNLKLRKIELQAFSGKPLFPIPSFKIGEGFIGKAINEGKTIVINDISLKNDPNYELLKELKIQSFISVCLGDPGLCQGIIICGSYGKRIKL